MSQVKALRALGGAGVCLLVCSLVSVGVRGDGPTPVAQSTDARRFDLLSRAGVGVVAPPAAQGPQSDKPVEQVQKNIQVLKGLPASQLFSVMNFVATSLGVRCDHCHVKRGEGGDAWVWESDEKPAKQTARRMMQMVQELNGNHRADFRDNAVTCYTCHRGSTKPVASPALPLAVSGHEPGGAAPVVNAAALPTVEQLFEKYVAAVGGRAAVEKLQTSVMKGTREASQGRVWPFEVTTKGTDKFLNVVQVPQVGTVAQGFEGSSGWVKNPRIRRELTPGELADLRRAAQLLGVVKTPAPAASMKVKGREKVGDREAFVVEHEPRAGVTERLFFDAQTGLLLRLQTITSTVLVPFPEQVDFEDYREVDGVKMPFVVRLSNIDTWFSYTRRLTEIKHNVPVDDALFKMPEAPPTPAPAPPE